MEVYYSPLQEVNQELIHKRLDFCCVKSALMKLVALAKKVALLRNDLHSDYEAYETVVAYMKARIESEGGTVVYVDEPSNNSREVIIPDGESVKVAYIDERIATSDVVISVNHIKANEYSGFSGAVNNTGWYSASLEGRRELVALTGTEHHKRWQNMQQLPLESSTIPCRGSDGRCGGLCESRQVERGWCH